MSTSNNLFFGGPCTGEIGFSRKIPVLGIFQKPPYRKRLIFFLKNTYRENNIPVVGSVLWCVETLKFPGVWVL